MSDTVPTPKYATLQQAAAYLSCDVKTIRRWITAGRIAGYRFGGRVIRVKYEDLDALARPIPTTSAS